MEWSTRIRPEIKPWPESTPPQVVEDPQAVSRWSLRIEDRTLYHALSRWAGLVEWQLIWEADRDFPIESNVHVSRTFLGALGLVMDTLRDSDYPLQAVVNAQTRVVRVVRHSDHRSR